MNDLLAKTNDKIRLLLINNILINELSDLIIEYANIHFCLRCFQSGEQTVYHDYWGCGHSDFYFYRIPNKFRFEYSGKLISCDAFINGKNINDFVHYLDYSYENKVPIVSTFLTSKEIKFQQQCVQTAMQDLYFGPMRDMPGGYPPWSASLMKKGKRLILIVDMELVNKVNPGRLGILNKYFFPPYKGSSG